MRVVVVVAAVADDPSVETFQGLATAAELVVVDDCDYVGYYSLRIRENRVSPLPRPLLTGLRSFVLFLFFCS